MFAWSLLRFSEMGYWFGPKYHSFSFAINTTFLRPTLLARVPTNHNHSMYNTFTVMLAYYPTTTPLLHYCKIYMESKSKCLSNYTYFCVTFCSRLERLILKRDIIPVFVFAILLSFPFLQGFCFAKSKLKKIQKST